MAPVRCRIFLCASLRAREIPRSPGGCREATPSITVVLDPNVRTPLSRLRGAAVGVDFHHQCAPLAGKRVRLMRCLPSAGQANLATRRRRCADVSSSPMFPIAGEDDRYRRGRRARPQLGWLKRPLRRRGAGRAFDAALPSGRALLLRNSVQLPIQRTESISLPSGSMSPCSPVTVRAWP